MSYTAPAGMSVGHVHLKVSDLDRSVAFYNRVLGLDVMVRVGDQAAFLSAGGYHHHLGLNTWESRGSTPPNRRHTGLYHVAFLYPKRADLGRAVQQMLDNGVEMVGAADHGVSQALYFEDPDENGIELYWDRPRSDWPVDADGNMTMTNTRLDIQELLQLGRHESESIPS